MANEPKVKSTMRLPDPPDPRVWDGALHLTPEIGPEQPELVSDGGGLPFTPEAAFAGPDVLDLHDPQIKALIRQIDQSRWRAMPERLMRPRKKPPAMPDEEKIAGFRVLAESDDQVLFGRGVPPQLLTVALRRVGRDKWGSLGVSNSRPLRAYRDGARASLWRVDPNFLPAPRDTEVRILLTEISRASGTPSADRLLAPELSLSDESAAVRFFVKPLDGYVGATRRHETPLILDLPAPLGGRVLRDSGAYEPPAG